MKINFSHINSFHRLVLSFSLLFSAVFSILLMIFASLGVSPVSYFFFSIIFAWLIGLCFLKKMPEFLKLLNILSFLGFWLKATSHIFFEYPFNEAAGSDPFSFLNQSLNAATLFGIILLSISIAYINFFGKPTSHSVAEAKHTRPAFYLFIILSLIFAAINWRIGFLRVGLASENSIPFPFSLLFSWFLGLGTTFSIFLYARNLNLLKISLITLVMCAISMSLVSRNSLVLFCYPILIYIFSKEGPKLKRALYLTGFLIFFGTSLFVIQGIRKNYDAITKSAVTEALPITQSIANHTDAIYTSLKSLSPDSRIDPYLITQTQLLFIERWIGFEGVLVAAQNQSDQHFETMLTENQKENLTSIYQDLAVSKYPKPGQMLFYTFPGPAGFIFFAESWLYRIAGFSFLAFLIIGTCYVIEKFTTGLAKSAVSWWAAAFLTQFSLFPIHNLKIYVTYLALIVIWILIENRLTTKSSS